MALLRPVLPFVSAFDATIAHSISFSVPSGGDQVVKNRLTIINQTTAAIVYQETQTSFNYIHNIPANSLINGTYYMGYINTFNVNNDMSPDSNMVSFYCYTTPSFLFTNIDGGDVVENSSFTFQVEYNQIQGELLNSYLFNLYDSQNVLIATSNVRYIGSAVPPPTSFSYEFAGLLDSTAYYIQCTGQTVNDTEVDTTRISFTVKYLTPSSFSLLELSQNCMGGYVTIRSNIVDIEGESYPDPPVYIDDSAVDLRGEGWYVQWDKGQFNISGDWTLQLWGKDFTPNSTIVSLSNSNGDIITVRYVEDYFDDGVTLKSCFECYVTPFNGMSYFIYSNYIVVPTDTNRVQLWLRRINNIYQIGIYNLGD